LRLPRLSEPFRRGSSRGRLHRRRRARLLRFPDLPARVCRRLSVTGRSAVPARSGLVARPPNASGKLHAPPILPGRRGRFRARALIARYALLRAAGPRGGERMRCRMIAIVAVAAAAGAWRAFAQDEPGAPPEPPQPVELADPPAAEDIPEQPGGKPGVKNLSASTFGALRARAIGPALMSGRVSD